MNSPKPDPVEQMNEWSCVLSCICWVLEKYEKEISQEELTYQIGLEFPKWSMRKGLCQWWDIPKIFGLVGIKIDRIYYSEKLKEGLDFFTDLSDDQKYFAGFVLTGQPTNHCLAIHSLTGDEVTLMHPNKENAHFQTHKWNDLESQNQIHLLLLGANP